MSSELGSKNSGDTRAEHRGEGRSVASSGNSNSLNRGIATNEDVDLPFAADTSDIDEEGVAQRKRD